MFVQVFGDNAENTTDADLVTAVEFDHTGDYLATGDRGGRVVVFQRNPHVSRKASKRLPQEYEWQVYHQFQSHEQEFDCLKSLEIEEKINCISWCQPVSGQQMLLTSNDKTIKLWKVGSRKAPQFGNKISTIKDGKLSMRKSLISDGGNGGGNDGYSAIAASSKHVFSNAHSYNINSICLNSDGDTFLSADDLRINWWNKEITDTCFNIVDIKPSNMEELTEVITSARFHPTHCNILLYSSSRGSIKIADTRQSALCDHNCKVFEEPADPSLKSFFSELVASISDARFSLDGRYVFSRDYLTVKIWDVAMEKSPVKVIPINNRIKGMLCELYESDSIFDKFEVTVSKSGDRMLTGSYGNQFSVWDKDGTAATIDLNTAFSPVHGRNGNGNGYGYGSSDRGDQQSEIDFDRKILHCSWNPATDTVALAAQSRLYIYNV